MLTLLKPLKGFNLNIYYERKYERELYSRHALYNIKFRKTNRHNVFPLSVSIRTPLFYSLYIQQEPFHWRPAGTGATKFKKLFLLCNRWRCIPLIPTTAL